MQEIKKIINKIENKKIKISIIGLGYVGLNLMINFARNNFLVNGYDIDKKKILTLKKNISPIHHIKNQYIKSISSKTNFYNDYKNISDNDFIIICLPTPLNLNNKPDLSHIKNFFKIIRKDLKKYQTIILESTSYPGTTEEIFYNYLNKNFNLGKDFFLGYSPERENPGDKKNKFYFVPKIVSGQTNNCLKLTNFLYSKIVKKTIIAKNIKSAEASKITENIYRSINIALVNELKMIFHEMKIDVREVLDLADTKPFGFKKFLPGPGIGGHCIPIDPLYLSFKAKKFNKETKFIDLAAKINIETTNWIYKKMFKKLKKLKINAKKILIVGVSYKKNIDDIRESAAIKIAKKLINNGILTKYYDPYVKSLKIYNNNKKINVVKLNTLNSNETFDCSVILTDHDKVDYKKILKKSQYVFDTRNVFKLKNKRIFNL